MTEKIKIFLSDALRRVDWVLLLCTTMLSVISLVTVYGAVDNFGMSKLKMQFAMTVAGLIITFIVANLDYHVIVDRLWFPMLVVSVGLLGITLVAGDTGAGVETANKSWLTIPVIGIAIQPSEFVKITFICTFAKHLSVVQNVINRFRTIVGLGIHALLVVGLILVSGDLGVALVYMALVIIMLFCAGLHWGYFAGVGGAVAVAFPFLWDFLAT
ncbi:MAG: FtsW/RodA/SpoVE family cell cycle protein, partial [Clostridia bacterium]|nr:FtsW/RodA/SpoVE family cell cycle protein [Clostridia bacterium]